MNRPVRIAHAYGNTRKSLRRALAAPIDLIETDIWFRGGQICVRHEPRLGFLPLLVDKRMPGHRLPPMSLRLWRGYYVRLDLRPILLDQVLEAAGGRRGVLLDLKGAYDRTGAAEFAAALASQIRKRHAESYVSVCGQFWPVLNKLRGLAPELEVRYSIERPAQWERFIAMVERGDTAPKICIEHRFLSEGKSRFLHAHGIEAYCWTVDDLLAVSRLMTMGVDGIISNDLQLLATIGG